jgi:hypothetical protein
MCLKGSALGADPFYFMISLFFRKLKEIDSYALEKIQR